MKDKLDFWYGHIPIIELIDTKLEKINKKKHLYQVSNQIELLHELREEIKLLKPKKDL